jgi:hypothetical protein
MLLFVFEVSSSTLSSLSCSKPCSIFIEVGYLDFVFTFYSAHLWNSFVIFNNLEYLSANRNLICHIFAVNTISLLSFAMFSWITFEMSSSQVEKTIKLFSCLKIDRSSLTSTSTIRLSHPVVLSSGGNSSISAVTSQCQDSNLVRKLLIILNQVLSLIIIFSHSICHPAFVILDFYTFVCFCINNRLI